MTVQPVQLAGISQILYDDCLVTCSKELIWQGMLNPVEHTHALNCIYL